MDLQNRFFVLLLFLFCTWDTLWTLTIHNTHDTCKHDCMVGTSVCEFLKRFLYNRFNKCRFTQMWSKIGKRSTQMWSAFFNMQILFPQLREQDWKAFFQSANLATPIRGARLQTCFAQKQDFTICSFLHWFWVLFCRSFWGHMTPLHHPSASPWRFPRIP